jgi:2-phosphosulfolactate phosphatase
LDIRATATHCHVVVDVLRACTTIAYALDAGATGVIPVEGLEEASRLAATLDRDSNLLAGERGCVRVEGFDLGNSPAELTSELLEGKTLVLATTNGARILAMLRRSRACLAASFVTKTACARRAALEREVTIVCAGSSGRFSLEDFLCAGMLVEEILKRSSFRHELDDAARTALDVSRRQGENWPETLRQVDHGRRLLELGFDKDLALASALDRFPFVPSLRDGRLVAEDPLLAGVETALREPGAPTPR